MGPVSTPRQRGIRWAAGIYNKHRVVVEVATADDRHDVKILLHI